ncbi:MAG TPA: 3-deoxy-D-manno-octulosonic acid kinase, partial [Tahibacter sp.]|nr:3-deoxy-D-manno-octulosonic acid kinase [Tahibacter sp.]
GECVLRHYRRGGLVARVLDDRYLWTGEPRTRAFAEFRLLQTLAARGLPVPAPVAARYRRSGPFYRADLLMRRIPQSRTLAQHLAQETADAAAFARVGATIARFHAAGAYHADLNAHNIMLAGDNVYLIDFDRGELREPESGWQRENLERLKRSLAKIGASDLDARWAALAGAYDAHRERDGAVPREEVRA